MFHFATWNVVFLDISIIIMKSLKTEPLSPFLHIRTTLSSWKGGRKGLPARDIIACQHSSGIKILRLISTSADTSSTLSSPEILATARLDVVLFEDRKIKVHYGVRTRMCHAYDTAQYDDNILIASVNANPLRAQCKGWHWQQQRCFLLLQQDIDSSCSCMHVGTEEKTVHAAGKKTIWGRCVAVPSILPST